MFRDLADPRFTPWAPEAARRGFRAVGCFPLLDEREAFGLLAVYASEPVVFDEAEHKLLQELADGLAFGLRARRADAMRSELEESLAHQLEELHRREDDYRTIIQTSIDGFAMADATGCVVDVNDAFCSMLGSSREELVGKALADITAAPGVTRLREAVRAGNTHVRIRHLRRDGREVDLEVSASFLDAQGARVAAFVRDVTDEVRAEEALREAQARLYQVLASAPVALYAVDAAGNVTLAQGKALAPRGELAGRSVLDSSQDPAWVDAWKRALGGQAFTTTLYTANHALEAHLSPMRSDQGAVVGASCVALDVTDRERSAEALRRTEEQSRLFQQQFLQAQKLEAVGRLAGGIAHDFNNLLTAINGYADLLVTELAEGDPRREDAAEISRAGHRAAALTRQLLLFSRRERPVLETFDLGEAVGALSHMLRRVIGEDVRLTIDLHHAGVRADRGQLEQLVLNLAVNARDAMPGGGTLTLFSEASSAPPRTPPLAGTAAPGQWWAVLRVSDTGCGMTDEVRAHVFEPFFTTKERGKGTGLGLATVYGIVQQLAGSIDVATAVGRGTTFTIHLPLAEGPVQHPEAPARPSGAPRPAGSATVLVVEDDEAVRRLVLKVLVERGFCVLEAADGTEAVRLCSSHPEPIHAVLTDVVMPGMSGGEVSRAAGRLRPDARVLYMSGHPEDVIARQDLAGERAPLLRKPFTPESLLAAVEGLLAR